jgi:uncharacterized protein (TIGR01777 family)
MKAVDMKTKILITGGTGMVGARLSVLLESKGYEVIHLSRKQNLQARFPAYTWDIDKGKVDAVALDVDHVVHLAGASVAGGRWSSKRKQQIYDSRINSTKLLVDHLRESSRLKSFVSASAIGIYGVDTGDATLDEQSPKGSDFLAQVVKDWETVAHDLDQVAVACLRIGIVLSNEGGALPPMMLPARFGLGAPMGSGRQYMSWIHIEDLVKMILFTIEQGLSGDFNAVAPSPVDNVTFTKILADQLHRPLWLPHIPGFVLKLALGEMSQLLLGGNYVNSKKIYDQGFRFTYKELEPALQNLVS